MTFHVYTRVAQTNKHIVFIGLWYSGVYVTLNVHGMIKDHFCIRFS